MKEKLEALLGEACERLDEAAGIIREMPELKNNPNMKNLGTAIAYVWQVRDRIYVQWPELKPDFVRKLETDS